MEFCESHWALGPLRLAAGRQSPVQTLWAWCIGGGLQKFKISQKFQCFSLKIHKWYKKTWNRTQLGYKILGVKCGFFRLKSVNFCYRFWLKPSTLAPRPLRACSYISRVPVVFRRSPHMQGGTCLCVLSDRGRSIQHRVSYDSTLVKCWRGGVVAGNKGRVVTWMDAISQARGWAPYALFFCCFCSTKMQYSFCLQMKS